MRQALSPLSQGVLFLASLFLLSFSSGYCQSTDSEIQRLQAQKDRAQLEADIAKAEKETAEAEAAAYKARLGSLNTANFPQGTVKTDSVVIEGSYLAYMAADSAARVIASQIPCGTTVVFFNAKDLDGIQALDALIAQIPLIADGARQVLEPLTLKRVSAFVLPDPTGGDLAELYTFPPQYQPAVLPAIFAGVDAGLSLLSLFKTDTELHGVTVSADDLALQSLVAKQWVDRCKNKPGKVILPSYSYPRIETDPSNNALIKELKELSATLSKVSLRSQNLAERVQAPLGKAVEGLRKLVADHRETGLLIPLLKAKLKAVSNPEEKKKLQADLDSAEKHASELSEIVRMQYDTTEKDPAPRGHRYSEAELTAFLEVYLSDQFRTDVRVQALKALQTKLSEFVAALTKPDSNGVTPLVALLRAQSLKQAEGESTQLLQVGFVAVGGNNITKKSFMHSKLLFSGGVVARYLLVDMNGYISNSGVVACYGGQLKESHLKESQVAKTLAPQHGAMACTEEVLPAIAEHQ